MASMTKQNLTPLHQKSQLETVLYSSKKWHEGSHLAHAFKEGKFSPIFGTVNTIPN